jgi:hypothetical protein
MEETLGTDEKTAEKRSFFISPSPSAYNQGVKIKEG